MKHHKIGLLLASALLLSHCGSVPRASEGSPTVGRSVFRALHEEPEGERAIVLLNGLHVHPFSEKRARQVHEAGWQSSDSTLGRALRPHGDLFAFSYSQNVPVERVVDSPDEEGRTLADHVRSLRRKGYGEVVLIGHSAGALVARQLVEDSPEVGVTKVIQVCAPNAGSGLGSFQSSVRASQEIFIESLRKEYRERFGRTRGEKRIPDSVEFVVVLARGGGIGDFVVQNPSQWPPDLQEAGIPVVPLVSTHFTVMRSAAAARKIAGLVEEPQSRWSPEEVARAKESLAGF